MPGGMLPPVIVELKGSISDLQAKLATARGELESTAAKGGGSMQKLASVGGAALAGIGIIAVGVGVIGVKAAMDLQAAHAQLAASFKATGTSMQAQGGTVDALDAKMRSLGFSDVSTEQALTKLTTGTKSAKTAESDLGVASDLARYMHISLASAANMVAKAEEGKTGIIARQLPFLNLQAGGAVKVQAAQSALQKAEENLQSVEEKVADGRLKGANATDALRSANERVQQAQQKLTDTQNVGHQAVQQLSEYLHGQASAYADTLKGKVDVLGAQFEHWAAGIGQDLIPILQTLMGMLVGVASFFQQNTWAIAAVGGVLGAILIPAIAAFIALKVQSTLTMIKDGFTAMSGAVQAVGRVLGITTAAVEADETAKTGDAAATTGLATADEDLAAANEGLGGSLATTTTEVEGSTVAMGEGEAAAGGMAGGLGGLVGPLAIAGVALAAVGLGLHSLIGGMDTSKIQTAVTDFNVLNGTIKASPATMLAAAGALDRMAGSTDYFTAATERSATYQAALQQQRQGLVATNLQLKQSEDDVGESVQALTQLQASGTASSADLSSSQDNVQASLMRVLAAAKANADQMTVGQSAGQRQVAENAAQYASLIQLAGQYPQVTGVVMQLIQQYGLMPPTKNTTITATDDTAGGVGSARNSLNSLSSVALSITAHPFFQHGGLVPGSGPLAATVHGGEVIINPDEPALGLAALASTGVLPNASDIAGLGATGGASGAPGGGTVAAGGAPGTTTVELTLAPIIQVDGSLASNPRQLGAKLAEAFMLWLQGGGNVTRIKQLMGINS